MNKIYICTNLHQMLAAKVAKYSILSRSEFSEEDIEILIKEEFDFMNSLDDQNILRGGKSFSFNKGDMQNFTLLRFHIPKLMNYEGKALVIDPDVFLVRNNLKEVFFKPTKEFGIFCRKGRKENLWSSSVMLLENSKLKHWKIEEFIRNLKNFQLDYEDLISLKTEKDNIGILDEKWNQYDDIKHDTVLLHTTEKITQPWRKGLPMNSSIPKLFGFLPRDKIYKIFGKDLRIGRDHPSRAVSEYFFNEFRKAYYDKQISDAEIKDAISKETIRSDIYKYLE